MNLKRYNNSTIMPSENTRRIILLSVLSLSFLGICAMQFLGKMWVEFLRWGFAPWHLYVIMGVQGLGALGLWLKKTSNLSCIALMIMSIGAILTNAGQHRWIDMIFPTVLFILTCVALRYLIHSHSAAAE